MPLTPAGREPPLTLIAHLVSMAYNNAWSNHRLLTAVRSLSAADFAAPRTSFFPSIRATLHHNLTVDWYYVDALERGLQGREVNPGARGFFIHHRGQAHAMLAGTSIAPPQLDEFFCVGDAALRATDFRELGYSEEKIWGSAQGGGP